MVRILGQNIALRDKQLEDASNDYSWRTDEELSSLDAATPITMTYPQFLRYYQDELRYPGIGSRRFAIETIHGQHIGNCMYYDIDNFRGQAELGIMIGDRNYWNKGYGADVVKTLVNHIFTDTTLNRIYLHTLEWNTRARRSFKKVGFNEVKKVNRDRKQFILMEIRRHEWLNGNQNPNASQDSPSLLDPGPTGL
ncbi:MAG: GNAT family N-acetyltransferase [Chloroflexi bacterium]|nr:GNAT family N-acetyltransferase [Chloroflexota bacterium]